MKEQDEKHFCISIAGHNIAINALHTKVHTLCEGYFTELPSDMQINISEDDIQSEREKANFPNYSEKLSYLETLVVYRKICEELISFDTILVHGAVIACEEKAFMFTAESGIGKTTHIKKWLENADNCLVVNGDKPLLKITESQVLACGTPWCGKEQLGTNVMVPLKAIVLMERAENNVIEEISYGQAFVHLLRQTHRPTDADKMRKTLELLSRLNGKVRFYRFFFNNMKDDAFQVAYDALMQ